MVNAYIAISYCNVSCIVCDLYLWSIPTQHRYIDEMHHFTDELDRAFNLWSSIAYRLFLPFSIISSFLLSQMRSTTLLSFHLLLISSSTWICYLSYIWNSLFLVCSLPFETPFHHLHPLIILIFDVRGILPRISSSIFSSMFNIWNKYVLVLYLIAYYFVYWYLRFEILYLLSKYLWLSNYIFSRY